jgi:SAM-dependent methyltransferase
MTSPPPRDHARRSYDAMAPVYDAFTAHHRYDEWCTLLERLALDAGLRGRRLLDVACGTGKSFEPFLARGYEVTACDLSPRMLEQARGRAAGGDGRPGARLLVADMRELPRLGAFDLVCLLDDAINYLDSEAELEATLRGVAANLAPDGVVVFDANTLLAYRSFFATASVVHAGDRLLVWDGQADPGFAPGDACTAELHVLGPAGSPDLRTHALSVHRQRHHPRDVVTGALARAGLGWSATFGMNLDGSHGAPLEETVHTKAIHVARKRAPQPGEGR